MNPNLVVHDRKGKTISVRYDQVNAMLLNEFLKARRRLTRSKSKLKRLPRAYRS